MAKKPPIESDIIRYEVGKFHLVFPDGVIDIPPVEIQEVSIDNDYENNFLPLLRVNLNIDTKVYFKMLKERDKLRVNFQLLYYKYNPEGQPDLKRTLFNKRFITLLDTNETHLMRQSFESSEELTKSGEEKEFSSAMNKKYVMELYLLSESDLNAVYKVNNYICTNGTMSTVMVDLLADAGVTKLLMGPLDNGKSYNSVIIPPITLASSFKYLNSQYGLYKEGAMLYLGLMYSYLLPKRPGFHAWLPYQKYKTIFLIRESEDHNHLHDGSRSATEENSAFINIKPQQMMIKSPMSLDYVLGSEIRSIGTAFNNLNTTIRENLKGTKQTKYIYNKYNNGYQSSMYTKHLSGTSNLLTFTINGANIAFLEPNKEFICKFYDNESDKIHGGKYMIERSHIVLRNNGDHMVSDAIVFLKR